MEIVCKKCGLKEDVSFFAKQENFRRQHPTCPTVRIIHTNKYGFRWVNGVCRECRRVRARKLRGGRSIEETREPRMRAALDAEGKAAIFFEKLGFSVERGHGRGPDLFCRIGSWEYTVEVKLAGKNAGSWRVSPVTKACQKLDLVAFVLPNGRTYIDDMQTHMTKCYQSGTRNITGIVKEFGLQPLPKTGK